MRTKRTMYVGMVLILAVLSSLFVAIMGFMNYRTSVLELYESSVLKLEDHIVKKIENALSFGKDYESFYGMDKYIGDFVELSSVASAVCVDTNGKPMYATYEYDGWEDTAQNLLDAADFERHISLIEESGQAVIKSGSDRILAKPIKIEDESVGYLLAVYNTNLYTKYSLIDLIKNVVKDVFIIIVGECILFLFILFLLDGINLKFSLSELEEKIIGHILPLSVITLGVLLISIVTIYQYQQDYRLTGEYYTKVALNTIEDSVSEVKNQGVDIAEETDLKKYIAESIEGLSIIRSVRISERIVEIDKTDEESSLLTFGFGGLVGEDNFYLEAEISEYAINKKMISVIFVLISTFIILMIFVFESFNIIEIVTSKILEKDGQSERIAGPLQVTKGLRLTGFLCSTAEYMCVPYAAMMIRDSGIGLLGLSVGVTAALPLTMEGISQMVGMAVWPKYVRKLDVRKVMIYSGYLMIACNILAFIAGGNNPLVIIISRTIAGFAYAGFKQVSNYLITKEYDVSIDENLQANVGDKAEIIEKAGYERSENFSQDNAGLLAGATCGAGLGAILSANMGYSITFVFSAVLFLGYMFLTYKLLPWKWLDKKTATHEEKSEMSLESLKTIIKDRSVMKYVILFAIPLNIGAMLCVTLIPAICQEKNISSVMLSFVYIANGLAGIYIGPALVSRAKKKFGIPLCTSFAFAITGASIFILKFPPIIVMMIISGMILGFLDGFATPLVTDYFMEIDTIKETVDESTALIFSVELSYVLLTFAPIIAEMLLLPGKGFLQPLYIGAVLYITIAVFIMLPIKKRA